MIVKFQLNREQTKLAQQLVKRERRDNCTTVDEWAKDVVLQYLHEFKVMPEAWGNISNTRSGKVD